MVSHLQRIPVCFVFLDVTLMFFFLPLCLFILCVCV